MRPHSRERCISLVAALAIALPASAHAVVDNAIEQRAPAFVAANATLTYTVSVSDLAYDFSYGTVMTDTLPANVAFRSASGSGWNCTQSKGIVTCSAESIPPGPNAITIVVTAPSTTGAIRNTANVQTLGSIDPITSNDTTTFDTIVFNPSQCTATAPVILSTDQRLAWTPAAGATRYRIFTAVEGAKPSLLGETTSTSFNANFEAGSNEWWVDAIFDSCPPVSSAHAHFLSTGNPPSMTLSELATSMTFKVPDSIGVDSYGRIFLLDVASSTLYRIDVNGTGTAVAGGTAGSADGPGTQAMMNHPLAMTTTPGGYSYIADSGNASVRQFYPEGNGVFFGPILATVARNLSAPAGIVASPSYTLFVSDTGNNAIRQMGTDFVVKTIAPTIPLNAPTGLALDADGNLFIADTGNNVVRRLGTDGSVTTFSAQFNDPTALAVDSLGNVYVADTGNHTIRRIAPSGFTTTLLTGLGTPTGLAFDLNGRLLIADRDSAKILVATIGPPVIVSPRRHAAGH